MSHDAPGLEYSYEHKPVPREIGGLTSEAAEAPIYRASSPQAVRNLIQLARPVELVRNANPAFAGGVTPGASHADAVYRQS